MLIVPGICLNYGVSNILVLAEKCTCKRKTTKVLGQEKNTNDLSWPNIVEELLGRNDLFGPICNINIGNPSSSSLPAYTGK